MPLRGAAWSLLTSRLGRARWAGGPPPSEQGRSQHLLGARRRLSDRAVSTARATSAGWERRARSRRSRRAGTRCACSRIVRSIRCPLGEPIARADQPQAPRVSSGGLSQQGRSQPPAGDSARPSAIRRRKGRSRLCGAGPDSREPSARRDGASRGDTRGFRGPAAGPDTSARGRVAPRGGRYRAPVPTGCHTATRPRSAPRRPRRAPVPTGWRAAAGPIASRYAGTRYRTPRGGTRSVAENARPWCGSGRAWTWPRLPTPEPPYSSASVLTASIQVPPWGRARR